jgi:WD40 repeat protein
MPLIPILFILLLSGCNGSSAVPLSSQLHAEGGSFAANISADASLSVVSNITNGLTVWDLKANKQLYTWSHGGEGNNTVANIHIAADNSYAVTSDREAFALWNLSNGEPEGFWRIDETTIRDIAVSDQGRGILVGRSNGKAMFFEPATGRRLEFLGHTEKINSVDISPNGYYALTGGNDYTAYLWDTRSGQVIHRFTHPSRVTMVALDDKGRYAFTADSKRAAKIWDLQTGEEISNLYFMARQRIFSTAVFSDDGKYLLTGSPAQRMNLWDVQSGSELQEWRVTPRDTTPKSAIVYSVAFSPDNQIISESSSGLAEIWPINE